MNQPTAVGLAVAASVSYGFATVLQAYGARRAVVVTSLSPRLLLRLLRSLPYIVGLGLDLVGFVAMVVALRELPLFTVQALVAASVGVTAVMAKPILHVPLSRRTGLTLLVLIAGLAALTAAAKPGPAEPLGTAASVALACGAALLAAVATAAARGHARWRDVTLAAVTGLAFGAVGIAARGLEVPHPFWHLLGRPAALAVLAYGVVAIVTLPVALQRGSVTVSAAVMLVVETIVPALVGVIALGDATRGHGGATLAFAGLAVTVAATVALARYAELPVEQ